MTTAEFLNELEKFKIVPPEIMQKLRDKLGKTEKDVTAKSVAKYLIDKGYLTNYQANQILTGATKANVEEELEKRSKSRKSSIKGILNSGLNPFVNTINPI